MASPVKQPVKAAFGPPAAPSQHIPQVDGQFNTSDDSDDDGPPKPESTSNVRSPSAVKGSESAASADGRHQAALVSEQTSGGSGGGNAGGPPQSPLANKSFVFKKVSLHAKGRKFGDKKRDQPGMELP